MQQKVNHAIKFFLIFCLALSLFSSLFLTKPNDNVSAQEPTPEAEPRVVGGDPAELGEYPWQVALVRSGATDSYPYFYVDQFCGGALVDPYWVLTAAHCVTDEDDGSLDSASSIDIVAGLYDLLNPNLGYQRRDVTHIVRYPTYNYINLDHDIALLRLSTPITLGGSGETATAIVELPSSSIGSLTGFTSWVSGWGKIQASPPLFDTELYEVDLPIISNSTCSLYWGGIISGNICAGDGTGKDSCSGDSGGPLVVYNGGEWVLAGIVSAGASACGDYPGIYTRVSYYVDWLNIYILPVRTSTITRLNSNPTKSASVSFYVDFNKPVTGVTISDFTATTTGSITGASVSSVSGSGNYYTVVVNTGSNDGTLRLDVVDDDTILDAYTIPLGGFGTGNGNFISGEIYTIDKTPPTVLSITRVGTSLSNMLNVSYLVTFSESVVGVDPADFTLTTTGLSGGFVSNVSGSGATRVVSVNTGQGDGTIRLDFVDNDSVTDLPTNPTSSGYTSGEIYTIDKPELSAPILRSPRSGGAVNDTTPNFIWQRVTNAQDYEIQIADDVNFTIDLITNTTANTEYTSIALIDGTYYWRVRANDVSNAPGKWSQVRTITIDTTGPIAPTLVSPIDNFNSPNRTPTFRWQNVTSAVQYRIQIDNNAGFLSTEYDVILRGITRKISPLNTGMYYWRVQAKDALGNWGAWSAPFIINIP